MATERTPCGDPRSSDVSTQVTCYGWVDHRRDHGGLVFVDLRDYSGVLQIVVNPQSAGHAYEAIKDARLEWVLKVKGTIHERGEAHRNPRLATGEVELHVDELTVLSVSKTPPFSVHDDVEVDERLRLEYRYLDLRRPRLQRNLRARARFIAGLRESMEGQGFVEIETPTLIRATPEGARDYLVPSRLAHGSFYALPQSPQLYKQLSMVGGVDRYYQIARCWRDEDLRADRQPEFTQLDLEMSFVDEDDVFAACEEALCHAWKRAEFFGSLTAPFPRMTWRDAVDRFGSDKPDTRFEMELVNVSKCLTGTTFRVFASALSSGGTVMALRLEGGAGLTRGEIEGELQDAAKSGGASGLAFLSWKGEEVTGPIAKFLTPEEIEALGSATGAKTGDVVFLAAGDDLATKLGLGALRIHLGRTKGLINSSSVDIRWITSFPMFEKDASTGRITAAHHPFTMVREEDLELLDTDPLAVVARAYDLVINGREIASGSIRIVDPVLQRKVLAVLGIDEEDAHRKFGFLLDAFEYGAPPHGGVAPGIDRLVMEGLREENIRDVIAFPKNQQAQEPMTSAPAPVDLSQLADLGLALRAPAKSEKP